MYKSFSFVQIRYDTLSIKNSTHIMSVYIYVYIYGFMPLFLISLSIDLVFNFWYNLYYEFKIKFLEISSYKIQSLITVLIMTIIINFQLNNSNHLIWQNNENMNNIILLLTRFYNSSFSSVKPCENLRLYYVSWYQNSLCKEFLFYFN